VGSFQGPNALLEPVYEREIVRHAAKDRLAKVNVCLHKTRDHRTAGRIDNSIGRRCGSTDLRYSFVTNQKVCTHDGIYLIHRDERAVFDED